MLPDRFAYETHPLPDPAAVVGGEGKNYRITVLTSQLLRLEYSPDKVFEDRATQLALRREFDVPEFEVFDNADLLELHTEHLHLRYDRGPFSPSGMSVQVKGNVSNYHSIWRYDTAPDSFAGLPSNLKGTARTLDGVDGPVPLADGLMSMHGYSHIDDSHTLALGEDGWVAPRREGNIDLYVLAHGHDYRAALADFYALSGPQPMLPRYAMGNWWSRYHPYSEGSYKELVRRFETDDLPFSVAVIDMDWHRVHDVDPKYGSGWTGYTWNRELFPDPEGFLGWLHERGLQVSLNDHPADGVRAFEDNYAALAQAMGVDPASELAIDFDVSSSEFLMNCFEFIHHRLEEQGVDFWWIDWQSGSTSKIPGLDPLWMLNHYHFLDSSWRGRRPLTFSRYAGLGSHRYPVGFSGDAVMSWESLNFQPYFTATAANVGYGWWSHDIGGHIWGEHDEELQARWYQFGVFSPINRLHTTLGEFYGREPWRYGPEIERVMGDFLRFRHRLVPYLYTMNECAHRLGEPIVTPLYYDEPERAQAYDSPNAYTFGAGILAAPITAPAHPRLGLGQSRSWIPRGTWFDLFTGLRYDGGRTQTFYRPISQIPVLAREGSILPLTGEGDLGVENPASLELRIFGAQPGGFVLYEDNDAFEPRTLRTRFDYAAEGFTIGAADGELNVSPASREYTLRFVGIEPVEVLEGDSSYDERSRTLTVRLGDVDTAAGASIAFAAPPVLATNEIERRVFDLLDRTQMAIKTKEAVYAVVTESPNPARAVSGLQSLDLDPVLFGALTEVLLAG